MLNYKKALGLTVFALVFCGLFFIIYSDLDNAGLTAYSTRGESICTRECTLRGGSVYHFDYNLLTGGCLCNIEDEVLEITCKGKELDECYIYKGA